MIQNKLSTFLVTLGVFTASVLCADTYYRRTKRVQRTGEESTSSVMPDEEEEIEIVEERSKPNATISVGFGIGLWRPWYAEQGCMTESRPSRWRGGRWRRSGRHRHRTRSR